MTIQRRLDQISGDNIENNYSMSTNLTGFWDSIFGVNSNDPDISSSSSNAYSYQLPVKQVNQLPVKQVNAIDLIVYLIPEVYIYKAHLITKSYLRQILQIILQNFHLHNTCYIRSSELLECGIDSIKIICGTDDDHDEMEFFIINDQSFINLKECFIKSKQICEPRLELKTYTQVQQELNEFMTLVQLQRSQKLSLRIPLNLLVRGASGCGKTDLVETWPKDQQCNVFRITSLQIVQPLPDDSEIQIRKIFQAAINFEKHFKSKGATVIFLEDLHLWYTDLGKNSKSIPSSLGELFLQIDQLFKMGQEIMCLATTSSSEKFDKFETEITLKPFALTNSDVTAYKPTESFDTIGGIKHLKKILNASILAGLKHVDAFSRFGLQLPKDTLVGRDLLDDVQDSVEELRAVLVTGADVRFVTVPDQLDAKMFK
uniref:ATPase AAA-type core domain-containing protein n=1 Tax=Glossina austeni TaxID=7395 RepID=A0A1A9V559_GLOAU